MEWGPRFTIEQSALYILPIEFIIGTTVIVLTLENWQRRHRCKKKIIEKNYFEGGQNKDLAKTVKPPKKEENKPTKKEEKNPPKKEVKK